MGRSIAQRFLVVGALSRGNPLTREAPPMLVLATLDLVTDRGLGRSCRCPRASRRAVSPRHGPSAPKRRMSALSHGRRLDLARLRSRVFPRGLGSSFR